MFIFIIYSVVSVYKLYMLIILDKNEYNYTKITRSHPLPLLIGVKKGEPYKNFKLKTVQNFSKFVSFRNFSDLSNLSSTASGTFGKFMAAIIANTSFEFALDINCFVFITVKSKSFKRKTNFPVVSTR